MSSMKRLTADELTLVKRDVGTDSVLASGVAQLVHAESKTRFRRVCALGVASVLVRDDIRFLIGYVALGSESLRCEHELYYGFTYHIQASFGSRFQQFEAEASVVGLSFADQLEARQFHSAVMRCVGKLSGGAQLLRAPPTPMHLEQLWPSGEEGYRVGGSVFYVDLSCLRRSPPASAPPQLNKSLSKRALRRAAKRFLPSNNDSPAISNIGAPINFQHVQLPTLPPIPNRPINAANIPHAPPLPTPTLPPPIRPVPLTPSRDIVAPSITLSQPSPPPPPPPQPVNESKVAEPSRSRLLEAIREAGSTKSHFLRPTDNSRQRSQSAREAPTMNDLTSTMKRALEQRSKQLGTSDSISSSSDSNDDAWKSE